MSFLGFLKSATVEEVAEKKTGGGPARIQRNPNPTFMGIRVWKSGAVFPSQALVDKFKLEYNNVTSNIIPGIAAIGQEGEEGYVAAKPAKKEIIPVGNVGNGFDVIDSRVWGSFKGDGQMLFIGLVPKNQPKVDLFGSTKYDAEGKPLKSVMEQGAATYGTTTLLPALKEIYGIELGEERESVDLLVAEELEGVNITEVFSKSITFVPKKVASGVDKGKDDYQRRENMKIFGLVPQELLQPDASTDGEATGATTLEDEQEEPQLEESNVMVEDLSA